MLYSLYSAPFQNSPPSAITFLHTSFTMKVIFTIISASLLIGSVVGILGGEPVSPKDAPENRRLQQKSYTTGIRKDINPNSNDDFSFCGGVLISRSHVLTTVMCTLDGNAKFVSVGAIYINGGEDGDEDSGELHFGGGRVRLVVLEI